MNVIIPEYLKKYLNEITNIFQGIEEIWLFGSRVNKKAKDDSDWDVLIWGNEKVLRELKKAKIFQNYHIEILIVYDRDHFESPWCYLNDEGKEVIKKGSLREWDFTKMSDNVAKYQGTKSAYNNHILIEEYKMYRIWCKNLEWLM